MTLMRKASLEGDLTRGHFTAHEERFGTLHSSLDDILVHRKTRRPLEQSLQM